MTEPGPGKVSFFAQLRGRGVLRVAASYGAIAWLLIQIAGTVAEPLDLPRWALRGLIFAAVLGFPVAIGLAWFLELTPQGVAVDRQLPGDRRPVTGGLRRYADVAIIGLLLLVVGYLLARQPDVIGLNERRTVAVLPFENIGRSPDGPVLATGIAESVLHQLANLEQLDVISRTSSFAFRGSDQDARDIGRQLKATYLLEGSVQSDRTRLRITTQLIDVRTGADVWSMRFDRSPSDIFAVQDEIALQVARALEITLDKDSLERMQGQGTESLDAYLAYVQARTLLAADRVADMQQAIEQLERAVEIDPEFDSAYVGLAEAGLFMAEYDVTEDRQTRFENALEQGRTLVERALSINPDNGEAYLVRASIDAYEDLATAEADYRRGLELSPNSAKGYHGLAVVLYETPSRRDEALAMLDRARKLDPLQPAYDVTRAVFLLYERADVRGANDLLADVLRRHPDYQPALARMTEVRGFCMGRPAESIEYAERALSLDPLAEDVRRGLLRGYLDVGDVAAAEDVVSSAPHESTVRRIPILARQRDWVQAGEAAYEAFARQTFSPKDIVFGVAAIRMHARTTHDFERARVALELMSGVQWDASDGPRLPDRPGLREEAIGLADVLIAMGRDGEGRRLLAVILERMRREIDAGRPEFWYRKSHPVAFALNDDPEAALAMLQRAASSRYSMSDWWLVYELEPAYATLRQDPRFAAMLEAARANSVEQRRELERRRKDGRVPVRGAAAP
jgi:TolB-like protein/Tfp pilus assembly protein PilF